MDVQTFRANMRSKQLLKTSAGEAETFTLDPDTATYSEIKGQGPEWAQRWITPDAKDHASAHYVPKL